MPHAKPQRPSVLQYVGWVPLACVIVVVLVLSLAGVTWLTSPYWGHNAQAQERNVGSVPTTTAGGGSSSSSGAAALALSPNRVELPTLKAQAPIVSVTTTSDGELEIPLNPKIVGWWKPGAKPGAKTGTAVFAGHINYAGVTGALADIGKLKPGDPVYVFGKHNTNRRAEVKFSVTGVRTYHKTSLPYQQIFDQKVVGRIALVTCGGPFDAATGNYLDNIVVYAVPA